MNAFQIKCYLFPESTQRVSLEKIGDANEIRRFGLASATAPQGLYQQLVDKIQSAYGDLLPARHEIRTYWVDEENELVGFSSDSEMQYAIDLQTAVRVSKPYETAASSQYLTPNSIFKVYVLRRSGKQMNENTAGQVVHPGVVCDGCDGPVTGIRYKCTVCKDYDLCGVCEAKDMHKEHPLSKILRPGVRSCPYAGGRHRGGGFFGNRCRRDLPNSQSFQETLNSFVPLLTNKIPIVNDPEQLKSFGEFMKTFLDPFGIDVDYKVSRNEKKEETGAKKSEAEKPATSAPAATADLLTGSKIDDEKMQTDASTTSLILEPTKEAEAKQTPFELAANALKNKIEENKAAPTAPAAAARDEEDQGFNLIDVEKELKYINSIETLKSMGYNDEGGWLTRLVIAKDGSINAVLDALNPSLNK